jgi:hypothetical protein
VTRPGHLPSHGEPDNASTHDHAFKIDFQPYLSFNTCLLAGLKDSLAGASGRHAVWMESTLLGAQGFVFSKKKPVSCDTGFFD